MKCWFWSGAVAGAAMRKTSLVWPLGHPLLPGTTAELQVSTLSNITQGIYWLPLPAGWASMCPVVVRPCGPQSGEWDNSSFIHTKML